MVLNLRKKNL